DGGYMYIVDCDDLEARREHFRQSKVRIVEDLKASSEFAASEAIHLHPRDTGGCLLSVDRHSGGADMMGGYKWAGPDWRSHDRSKTMSRIAGARLQSPEPEALADRWSKLLQRSASRRDDGAYEMTLDHGFVRFGPLEDDRGEGLSAVYFACKDKPAVLAAAEKAGAPHGASHVDLVGVRCELV